MDIAPRIAARLASGVLPKQLPTKRWAGYGSSHLCDGCELPIYARSGTNSISRTVAGFACIAPAPKRG